MLPLVGRAANAELLLRLLNEKPSDMLQVAAVRNLIKAPATTYVDPTLATWPKLSYVAREELVASLLASPDKIRYLVGALERGTLPPSELDAPARFALARLPDADLRSRVVAALGQPADSSSESWRSRFRFAQGDSAAGAQVYTQQCRQCHQLMQFGTNVGPHLDGVAQATPETLREEILRPHRIVSPRFDVHLGVTSRGQVMLGRLRAVSADQIALGRTDDFRLPLDTGELVARESSGVSFMPDQWENALTPEDLSNLIEFLRQPRRNFLAASESQRGELVSLLYDGKQLPEPQAVEEPTEPEPTEEPETPATPPQRPTRIPRAP